MKKQITFLLGVAATVAVTASPALRAQDSGADLRGEIEQLKQGQERIQKQLQEIKRLLQIPPSGGSGGPNVAGKVFDLGDNPIKGASSAKLTLVEFTDYQ